MIETINAANFSRPHLAEMINFRHPLSMLASRLPRSQIKATVAPCFARRACGARVLEHDDLVGASLQVAGADFSTVGPSRVPVPLVVSLLLNVAAKLAAVGVEIQDLTPQAHAKLIKSDLVDWDEVFDTADIEGV